KEDPNNKGIGMAADMLAPSGFGEITSGGLREDDIVSITERIKKEGLDPRAYEWYLDLRKYGSVPHGGFGLGIERLVRWITNVEVISDPVLCPRVMWRVTPDVQLLVCFSLPSFSLSSQLLSSPFYLASLPFCGLQGPPPVDEPEAKQPL